MGGGSNGFSGYGGGSLGGSGEHGEGFGIVDDGRGGDISGGVRGGGILVEIVVKQKKG